MESTYDHSKYLISYEVHASNLMPDIDVIILTNKGETAMRKNK